ncbi:MAG TPA: ABC transporter substrate-binding protein [Holophagaceae bacterium]|jgi:iron complex transport system substrate-binding protein|nr:ABC transporter substrate-binding protein [Holophagaceae bacterium]
MNACSFLPACTHMIHDLGLDDRLAGVTFECPSDKPKIIRSVLEGHAFDSAEIDRVVTEAAHEGRSLYTVDRELLERIAPDLVFTQHVCDVCQIGTSEVERAIFGLPKTPKVVPLVPRRFEDVVENALTIARELGDEPAGTRFVAACRVRLDAVTDRLRAHRLPVRRAMVLEWMDPLYNCGHWIPDQIARAGGSDALSNPAGYSVPLEWERLRLYDPEVLVAAPCGFHVDRAEQELDRLTRLEGWDDLQAVRSGRAFLADADLFTQPSLGGLVNGVELLAALFHPDHFEIPAHLRGKVRSIAPRPVALA